MAHAVTCADLLARVKQLAPVIREYADRGERERHLMDPVVEALQDAGLYSMLVPRTPGGLQVDPLTLVKKSVAARTSQWSFRTAPNLYRPCGAAAQVPYSADAGYCAPLSCRYDAPDWLRHPGAGDSPRSDCLRPSG